MIEKGDLIRLTIEMPRRREGMFRKAMGEFTDVRVIGESEAFRVDSESRDDSWAKELDGLRSLVDSIKVAELSGDEKALTGFRRLNYLDVDDASYRRAAINVLDRSVGSYEQKKERPGRVSFHGKFWYKPISGALTPVDLRLLVGIFNLNGQDADVGEVVAKEGRKGPPNHFTIRLQNQINRLVRNELDRLADTQRAD